MPPLQRLQFRCLLTVAAFALTVPLVAARAADKATDPLERSSKDSDVVYTNPLDADEDFTFVGEYRGFERPTASGRSSRTISLQVNAVGGGRFVGTKMFGGTPNELTTRNDPVALEGERLGSRVRLRGPRFDYLLDGQFAYVVNHERVIIGKLTRSDRTSPTIGRPAPSGAVILFDGQGTDNLKAAKVTDDGLLQAGTETIAPWEDFQMHVEFRLPYKPEAAGQHRGNSGVYIQSRYEVQVLDSFGWIPAFNDCSSLYRTKRPDRNATLPPLTWQTYDIDFRAARFDASGNKVQPAQLTVWLNGVKTHDHVAIPNKTGAGKPEGPEPLPIKFQEHRNPVMFRNMWLLPGSARTASFAPPSETTPIPPTPITLSTPQFGQVHPLQEVGLGIR